MEPKTYHSGQLFRVDERAGPFLLVVHSNYEGRARCCLVELADGNRFADSIRVEYLGKITSAELCKMAGGKAVEYICDMPYVPINPARTRKTK